MGSVRWSEMDHPHGLLEVTRDAQITAQRADRPLSAAEKQRHGARSDASPHRREKNLVKGREGLRRNKESGRVRLVTDLAARERRRRQDTEEEHRTQAELQE